MKEIDVTQGNPIPPNPYETSEYLDSIYQAPRTKRDLLEHAVYLFISDAPFPPRMRSDFVSFRVTPRMFEASVVATLLQAQLDGESVLPSQAKRSEVREIFDRWMSQESDAPMTMEKLKQWQHFTLVDKSHYLQLYQVPLSPPVASNEAQHGGEAHLPKLREVVDTVHIPKL